MANDARVERIGVRPGDVVVVTGGTRGIGEAIARGLADDGASLVLTYRDDASAAAAIETELRARGTTVRVVRADVAEPRDVISAFDIARALGTVRGVVLNAGITGGFCSVAELSDEALRDVLATNVAGAFLCAREAVRTMATSRGGSGGAIVAIGSRAARLGSPGEYVHYAASKAALETMTLGLAKEVARDGIRVTCVAPGLIDTAIHARAGRPGRLAELAPTVPLGRAGTPDEVADAVRWLLSPAASYVTGTTIDVSGGR